MPPKVVCFLRFDGLWIVVNPEEGGGLEVGEWTEMEEWLRKIREEMAQMMME
jgi:hypothetical protein